MAEDTGILYVLYKAGLENIAPGSAVLSFMPPDKENGPVSSSPRFLFGRKEMGAVREAARKAYVDLIARLAATPCGGRTLRQALEMEGRGNPWWYHSVSVKDAESDDTFNMLLQIFTILHVAEKENTREVIIYGAPIEVARVLETRYKTDKIACVSGWKKSPLRAMLSRARYLLRALYLQIIIKQRVVLPGARPEIVFQGFLDWSVRIDEDTGRVRDSYFKSLPDDLEKKGRKCAWFAWLDPYLKPGSGRRSIYKILKPVINHPEIIIQQAFLDFSDILSAIFDLRPLCRYIRYSRSAEFRRLFREMECDLWPLLKENLLYNFCNATMPHCYLMETSYKRAFALYKPRMAFSFLELFLSARVFYQGARSGSPGTIICDMQHSSYGREKTFILIDPARELGGDPDSHALPAPHNFFVMGDLCRDILVEDGFLPGKIFVTGSARYDHIRSGGSVTRKKNISAAPKILIVSTLNVKLDFEMVRAAHLAAEGLNLALHLRSHPLARMEEMPAYGRYSKSFISSANSLEDDLNAADLILFTYSSVAEEAFLKGIPILRWQAAGFNGSVFRDMDIIPVAYSVKSLRQAFKAFIDDPCSFRPDRLLQDMVLSRCFYKTDGMASGRISERVVELLGQGRTGS